MQHYRQRRDLTDFDVNVTRGKDSWPATVSNASADGMRLKGKLPLMLDDEITVEGGSWSAEGRIVWIKDGHFGLELTKPLDQMVLSRLTGKSKRLNRKSRVGFGHSLH